MSNPGLSEDSRTWPALCQGDVVREIAETSFTYRVLIGVDDPQLDEAVLNCHSSANIQVLNQFLKENELARHYILIAASPSVNLIAHEASFTLLDRPLSYGTIVKKSPKDSHSGTVIDIGGDYDIAHGFSVVENDEIQCDPQKIIRNIEAEDLVFSREWELGDYVIWNNCWLGEIVEMVEAVTICLSNNSAVTIETPGQLKLKLQVSPATAPVTDGLAATQRSLATQVANIPQSLFDILNPGTSDTTDPDEPVDFQIGQIVETTKGNLRRGRWRYGAYDPNIEPVGKVVEVRVASLCIDWICQNMMVRSRFVPIEPPEPWISQGEEAWFQLKKFNRLSDGGDGLGSTDLERYDRVRFRDINAAMEKYNTENRIESGRVVIEKVDRSSTLGYDVNEFMILARSSWVTVQWQDLTVTNERSISLIRCDSSDEHELWPGDFVITKPEIGSQPQTLSAPRDQRNLAPPNLVPGAPSVENSDPPLVFVSPGKVGVVQSVDAASRIAKVSWFKSPKVELAGEMIIPGSVTGPLDPEALTEVSMYEVAAHPALSICRGDYVLVAPEGRLDDETTHTTNSITESAPVSTRGNSARGSNSPDRPSRSTSAFGTIGEALRGIVDTNLIANLSASLTNTTNPQLHTLSRMLHQFPMGLRGELNTPPPLSDIPAINTIPDWFGEVVDKGLDGLVTVRLGALDQVRNIKVPIERLTVVFDGEDFGDEQEDYADSIEMGSDDERSLSSGSDYSMEADDWISEQIFYEGGEPMETGNEADWLTDDDTDSRIDEMEIEDLVKKPMMATKENPNMESFEATSSKAAGSTEGRDSLTSGLLAPSDKLSTHPARFSILEGAIPADHAFANQPVSEQSVNFLRRTNKEHKILQTSLPEGIFVRTWESRLDLLRVLIIGPQNTPYELAPFVFDFHLGANFPVGPPVGYFHSWTNGIGRVNPNLYEDGKICLSLLGTWHGEKKSENWSSSGSSILQVLVSLMGLVLVKEPYYNEAGFNVYVGAEEATVNALLYSERAFILSRGFVKRVLEHPVPGLEDILNWLYNPILDGGMQLLGQVVRKGKEIVEESEQAATSHSSEAASPHLRSTAIDGIPRLTAGAIVLLKKTLYSLDEVLIKALGH